MKPIGFSCDEKPGIPLKYPSLFEIEPGRESCGVFCDAIPNACPVLFGRVDANSLAVIPSGTVNMSFLKI